MRLAVISDIHGNLKAFEATLDDLAAQGEFDQIWCLGDLAALGPHPSECIQRVCELKETHGDKKFKVIGGNTDRYLVTGERLAQSPAKDLDGVMKRAAGWADRDAILNWNVSKLSWEDYEFLKSILNKEIYTQVKGFGPVIGFHAIPGNDEAMSLRPDSTDEEASDALLDREGVLALCGHTHLPMDRNLGQWRVINPGSIGISFTQQGYAEWAIVDINDGQLTVDLRTVPYSIDNTVEQARAAGYPRIDWLINRLKS